MKKPKSPRNRVMKPVPRPTQIREDKRRKKLHRLVLTENAEQWEELLKLGKRNRDCGEVIADLAAKLERVEAEKAELRAKLQSMSSSFRAAEDAHDRAKRAEAALREMSSW